jgi:hypothetical protein
MSDDVVIDLFECVAQWSEQVLGQSPEEQAPDQVDVAGRGPDNRSPGAHLPSIVPVDISNEGKPHVDGF